MKLRLKNIFSFALVFVITFACFGLTACGKNKGSKDNEKVDLTNSNVLVAYFSAQNHTKQVAIYIQELLSADVLEITPTIPYSSADLDWTNSSSRVSLEHNNRGNSNSEYYRPAFNNITADFENYDIIFIGYPIWWGEAPNIVYNFMETFSDEFSEKTIIPFCTSSSSGLGQSATNLHSIVSSSATWLEGQRFSSSVSRSTVENWVKSLSITEITPPKTENPSEIENPN